MIADHPLSSSQRGPMANNSDKWSVLAVTRFLLATCVLITHSGVVAPGTRIFAYLGHTGYPAVFAFFMISGYSIAHSITVSPRGYVWRRAKRIFPSYVAALALSAVVALPGPLPLPTGQLIPAPTVMDILGNLFMMQGILCDTIVTDGPLWSISIEWWLYMTAPVLALFTYRAAAVCAFVSFAGLVAYYWVNGYVQVLPYGWNPLLLGWSWFAGFAFYHKRSLVTFLLLVLPPLILFDIYIRLDFGPAIVGVTAATILFADSVKVHRWARPVFTWLGDMSYPLYLLHVPLMFAVVAYTPLRRGTVIMAVVMVIVGLSYWLGCIGMNRLGRLTPWLKIRNARPSSPANELVTK